MFRSNTVKPLIAIVFLAQLASCNSTPEGTYRGGVLVQPRPLGIDGQYVFTLLDKWRIRHAWFSGPPEIDYCRYTRRDGGMGEDRFIEVDGILKVEYLSGAPKDSGKNGKYIYSPQERVYGTNPRTGKFQGYSAFCKHTFQDIWAGPVVFLIKPDSSKGTDEWVSGATPVAVNGLHWRRKDSPIEDFSRNTQGKWAAPIETWVLAIPDTPYWLVMRLGGSSGGSGTAPGANRNPEKYAQVLGLFHQMIASVKLEPITPTIP